MAVRESADSRRRREETSRRARLPVFILSSLHRIAGLALAEVFCGGQRVLANGELHRPARERPSHAKAVGGGNARSVSGLAVGRRQEKKKTSGGKNLAKIMVVVGLADHRLSSGGVQNRISDGMQFDHCVLVACWCRSKQGGRIEEPIDNFMCIHQMCSFAHP